MAKQASQEEMRRYGTRLWRHAREFYRQPNDLYGKLIAYCLDLQHYKRTYGMDNDVRRIQPKGQRLFNLIRHKLSLLTTEPISFDCHPIQPNADAYGAQLAKKTLEATVFNPTLRYSRTERSMVMSALAGGRGCMASEYDPDVPGGSCLRLVDPRRLFVTPGVLDFHDSRAPFCIEEVPMHLSAVRAKKYSAGWDVPDDLLPDNWKSDYSTTVQNDLSAPLNVDNMEVVPGVEIGAIDGIVTVLKIYYRFDPFQSTQDRGRRFDLPREDWYWLDDETQEKVPAPTAVDPLSVPAPTSSATGQPLRLVTTMDGTEEHMLYPNGCCHIVFPHYIGQKRAGWYGDWLPGRVNQDVRLTNFPYTHMTAYHHPLRLIGKSDTELLHSLQQLDDTTTRQSWEQLRMAQAIMVVTRGGLEGPEPGSPFELDDRPFQIGYARDRMVGEAIKFFQANGMNPAVIQFKQILDREWAQIGTGDIAMPDDRSRDVAVGTIQALQQQGDLPIRMHAEDLKAERSIILRVILDQKRAYMSVPELVRWVNDDESLVGPDGQPVPVGAQMAANVTGDMIAASNVIVTAQADWRAMDIDRVQAISQFCGQVPPPLWGVMAPEAGFSPTAVTQLRNMAAQLQAPPAGQPPVAGQGKPPVANGSQARSAA